MAPLLEPAGGTCPCRCPVRFPWVGVRSIALPLFSLHPGWTSTNSRHPFRSTIRRRRPPYHRPKFHNVPPCCTRQPGRRPSHHLNPCSLSLPDGLPPESPPCPGTVCPADLFS